MPELQVIRYETAKSPAANPGSYNQMMEKDGKMSISAPEILPV